jgi:hypothetical protein
MRKGITVVKSGNAWKTLSFLFCIFVLLATGSARADVTVSVAGPGGSAQQALPDEGGSFDLSIPLNKNALNTITVTATDSAGNSASQELKVTQLALDEIVVSKITATRLSVQEVEQLVNEGIIDLADPANYNVSTFDIVLTIANQPVPVRVPIAVPKMEEQTGYEVYRLPKGGDSSGGKPNPPPPEIIVFDQSVPGPPGEPPISIPGVLVIEGKIKSLKEFYSVRLLLMNTSGIFTLTDITAKIVFPEGGLSAISPKDGIISFGEILPGEGNQPGQKEKEYIIRGDEIGIRDVRVDFGGLIRGPGIEEDAPIPFNGSALTEVEVKGPPTFKVEVGHPDSVIKDEPYELKVDITNTADIPAMYASLSIALGADGVLVKCTVDDLGEPLCTDIEGEDSRYLGHILPGQKVSQVFTIRPLKTGVISSCMGASDQNISLQVYVGNIGCMVGQFPPAKANADGSPAVSVLPNPNATGIHPDSPVTAFFSELMNESTIRTGPGGSFNVFDSAGNEVWGQLRLISLPANDPNGKTVAIWQPTSGVLIGNKKYTVILTTSIADQDGKQLGSKWESTFTTTGTGMEDQDPPTVSLSIDPSVNPSYVLPGQIVKVDTYTADQGSGVSRVEARLKDLNASDAQYQLIDQKTVFSGDKPPFIFSIDSANLERNHAYQFRATVYDGAGNSREATIAFRIAPTADAPTLTLPADPADPVLHGISVDVTPLGVTGGVREVRFYLDGAANPFRVISVAPYRTMLGTLGLTLGAHTVRAVAYDPLGQFGEDTLTFQLVENLNMPSVHFGSAVDGSKYAIGEQILVKPVISDPVGLAAVTYYLDGYPGSPEGNGEVLFNGFSPILFDTTGRSLGSHTVYVKATNNLGISNNLSDPDSSLQFVITEHPEGPPPAAPSIQSVSYPENGAVTLQGTSVSNARITVTNSSSGASITVNATISGSFTAQIPAQAGNTISIVAYDLATSIFPSVEATVVVQAAPVLTGISVNPQTRTFNARNAYQDVVVTGFYSNGSSANITSQASFSSSNTAVASVSASGRIAALRSGTATITATYGDFQATVAITCVITDLLRISVDPATVNFIAINQAQSLSVTGYYTDGSTNWSEPLPGGNTFISGDPNVATVSTSGLVKAIADGSTQISVSRPGITPVSVAVNVNTDLDPAPAVEILNPSNGASVERGQNVSISVKATDAFGGVAKIALSATGQTTHAELRQISPALLSTTQTFSLPVSTQAAIGGTIVVSFVAEDTGGNTSSIASITLNVADFTAPTVSVTDPANQARFNYGATVQIEVSAADLVGVTRIRYEATKAVVASGTQDFAGAPLAATASFRFNIPFGVQNPDIRILAYAIDAAGNERASAPVDIVITDADLVAPSTRVTSVVIPPGSAIGTVSYEITSDLADLDHVELYFRRNGLGTFNRYTDADGGNPLGEYTPLTGNTGAISFDSTKMGGDGNYEFYTVGVDVAGNRELPPMDDAPILNLPLTGLLAYYPFNGNALDESGNGHDGIPYQTVLTQDRSGRTGKAYLFDGTNAYIDAGPADSFNFNGGTGNFTLASLIKPMAMPAYAAGIIGKATSGVDPYTAPFTGWGFYFYANGRLCIGNAGIDERCTSSGVVSAGPWAHVAVTRSGNLFKIYKNGVEVLSTNYGNLQTSSTSLRIGSIYPDFFRLNGTIDEVAIYDRALSGSEIQTLSLLTHIAVVADQTADFAAGAQWTTISTSTTIGAGDSAYDNQNLRITGSGVVVTMDGPHAFKNVELLNGAMLTHSETTTATEYRLDLNAWTLSVDAASSIDVTGRGYLGGKNYKENGRTLGNVYGSIDGAGGSYGGLGGGYQGHASNDVYGSLTDPEELGSGGGAWEHTDGGDGGGRIKLNAVNIVVDGSIQSNGDKSDGSAAGDGSGGSINLTSSTISGIGYIQANGGGNGAGGGGGRIAVTTIDSSTLEANNVQALGGFGHYANGANGTVVFIEQSKAALILMGQGASTPWTDLTIPEGYTFDSVTLRDNARVIAHDAVSVTGKLVVTGNSILTQDAQNTAGLVINARIVQIDEGSAIDVTGKGYLGGKGYNEWGRTIGDVSGVTNGAGGAYGGTGSGHDGRASGPTYGDPRNPIYLGSGGGAWEHADGGDGGGRITIHASEAVLVNGSILANGGESEGSAAGDGSGGSILIHTSRLSGSGHISAHGGGNGNGVGGGGGRIAIYCDYVDPLNDMESLYNIAAFGRTGRYDTRQSTAGTVYIKYSSQENGNLYIDAGLTDSDGNPNRTSPDSTIFPRIGFGTASAVTETTLTTDGLVPLYPGSLVGLRLNPDITQSETFVIQSNDGTTITVATPNENNISFSEIAAVGKTYAGAYLFDNVFFRRGGNLMIGDLFEIKDTLLIEEYGKLTGYDATESFISWMDITAGNLIVGATGIIDATARGYIGGRAYNQQGRTVGNVFAGTIGAGGSYGGLAWGHQDRASNPVYGSLTNPMDLGSGGGAWEHEDGGDGGGLILIQANRIVLNGAIRSNGGESTGSAAGDGSGGTVNISVGNLSGNGSIQANGGGSGNGSGGGGGRIAIHYSKDLSLPEQNISAIGGTGYYGSPGGNGTVFFKHQSQEYGHLIIDGFGRSSPSDTTRIPGGYIFDDMTVRNAARVVADEGLQVRGALRLSGNSIITHGRVNESGLTIDANFIEIDAGSSLDATGRGYRGGTEYKEQGYTLGNVPGASIGAGGSYGGLASGHEGRTSNPIYGSLTNPLDLGSGGGAWEHEDGGYGGGLVRIHADSMILNGSILANGGESSGSAAGDGSGGTVNISVGNLSGDGSIQANGGGNGNGSGGGGGRIAIHYTASMSLSEANISAIGGTGYYGSPGGNGTVYLKHPGQANGELIIDGFGLNTPNGTTRIPEGYTFDTVTLRNAARVVADAGIEATGTLELAGNSVLIHGTGNEAGLHIRAATLRIDAGSSIDVTGRGYPGGKNYKEAGRTLGNNSGAALGSGGTHGGTGGSYQSQTTNSVYGDPKNPVYLGSGGGAWEHDDGGDGGGRVTIESSSLIVNGAILANGGDGSGSASGNGSGGSILIRTSSLAGNGSIAANGGGNGSHVGGGGGRVAIYCDSIDPAADFNALRSITAFAGKGNYDDRKASAGTVYIKYGNKTDGDLYIDANVVDAGGIPNGTAIEPTYLNGVPFGITASVEGNTLTTDGLTAFLPGALVGLRINPDVTQEESFVITANTASTVTVESINENGIAFSSVAGTAKTYAGVHIYDNVFFRRGGYLIISDRLIVPENLRLEEYGRLSHLDATATFVSFLDLTVGNLFIDSGSLIESTGRGYMGGKGYKESGRTLNNAPGSGIGAGGSYGGLGGRYSTGMPNAVYGSSSDAAYLGSGGGAWEHDDGGDGGGLIFINAGSITLDGEISANGGEGTGSASGNGSGGSVNIQTGTLSGTGYIYANGGGSGVHVGGGGGRIDIRYLNSLSLPVANVRASGGTGKYGTPGADGTVNIHQ